MLNQDRFQSHLRTSMLIENHPIIENSSTFKEQLVEEHDMKVLELNVKSI